MRIRRSPSIFTSIILAQALSSWDECSNAWQKALECLSKPGLNPADLTLRKQVEEGLNLAKAGSARNAETAKLAPSLQLASLIASANPVTAPWARAEALKEEIRQDFSRESSGGKEVMPSCVRPTCRILSGLGI